MLNDKINNLVKSKVLNLSESAVPGKPAERVGALTNIDIPQSERDAAKARLLAKTAAKRKEREMKEETGASKKSETKFHLQLDKLVHKTFGSSPEEKKKMKKEEFEVCDVCGQSPCACGTVELDEKAPPGAKYERMVKHVKKNYPKGKEGIAFATAWKAYNKANEEFEIEEGMSMKDFKANRKKIQRKEASADAEKRGHVGKEWYNSGRKYSPDEAKRSRANMDDEERRTRHRSAVDPEGEDSNYSADKTKNPKKLRKQAAMGESLTFSQFMEARRMDREGVDRGDAGRAGRAAKAKASLAAKAKRDTAIDKYEKSSGRTVDRSKSVEYKAHAKNHPGSRQEPKVKGAKETPAETHSRRVNRQVARVLKHGPTSKEKRENQAMAKHTSRFD